MSDTERMAGYRLIETGTLVHFDVVKTHVERPEALDETIVRIEMQLGELEDDERTDDVAWGAFGFVFVLAVQSYGDARPRGVSEMHFEERDEFLPSDLLDHLRYERGELRFAADYLRGRCMKTDVTVSASLIFFSSRESAVRVALAKTLAGEQPMSEACGDWW